MQAVEIPVLSPVEIPVLSPVEINAGAWYLRALRADDRISDVPALSTLGVADPVAYVAGVEDSDDRCVWAVCIPTTGELVALIGVTGNPEAARLAGVSRDGYAGALADAQAPVRRFAEQALGLLPGDLIHELP